MVAGGLIFSALGTCLCTRENRARGGPKTIGCTHRAADDTRPKAERRGTRTTPKSAATRAKNSPVGRRRPRRNRRALAQRTRRSANTIDAEIGAHSREDLACRRRRETPKWAGGLITRDLDLTVTEGSAVPNPGSRRARLRARTGLGILEDAARAQQNGRPDRREDTRWTPTHHRAASRQERRRTR